MSRESTSATPHPSALVAGMATGDDRALGALYDAYGHPRTLYRGLTVGEIAAPLSTNTW